MDDLFLYLESLVGSPYKWWQWGDPCVGDHGPLWAADAVAPLADQVHREGILCTGVANLARRAQGLPIPGVKANHEFGGGISVWWWFLEEKGLLKPYDPEAKYPKGTLLLQAWENEDTQGHIAIQWDNGSILHARTDTTDRELRLNFQSPGCLIETIEWPFHAVCYPDDWLLEDDS